MGHCPWALSITAIATQLAMVAQVFAVELGTYNSRTLVCTSQHSPTLTTFGLGGAPNGYRGSGCNGQSGYGIHSGSLGSGTSVGTGWYVPCHAAGDRPTCCFDEAIYYQPGSGNSFEEVSCQVSD